MANRLFNIEPGIWMSVSVDILTKELTYTVITEPYTNPYHELKLELAELYPSTSLGPPTIPYKPSES